MHHISKILVTGGSIGSNYVRLGEWMGFMLGLAWMLSGVLHLNRIAAAMLMSELFIAIVCSWLAYRAITENLNRKAMPQ